MAVPTGAGRRALACCLPLLLAALVLAPVRPALAEPVTVFAAASLTDALEEIGAAYRQETGSEVRFSFASSSTLARQIEAGAPAQIFASADAAWMDYLAARGLVERGTRRSPIGNRLVLIAPADSRQAEVAITESLNFAGLLGPDGRLAVGDPAHVPAGIYAEQALKSLGQWKALEPRLARADDVRAALALVDRGEAPLGIVYATDAAISDEVKVVGVFPESSHRPIAYPFVILEGQASEEVRRLFAFLTAFEALEIFKRYGFSTN